MDRDYHVPKLYGIAAREENEKKILRESNRRLKARVAELEERLSREGLWGHGRERERM